jgi:type VI secretion system protein ImpF
MFDSNHNKKYRIDELPCFSEFIMGEVRTANKIQHDSFRITIDQYKNIVIKDLILLLNSYSKINHKEIPDSFSEVKSSVITYGVSSFSGSQASQTIVDKLLKNLKDSIIKFEPRIESKSLKVELSKKKKNGNDILVDIYGNLIIPTNNSKEFIKLKLAIDIETGSCELN